MMPATLMRMCSAAVLGLLSISCAYQAPQAPTPAPPASTTAPFSLTLGAAVGQGVDAGRAVVTAKVQNVNGVVLPDVTVGFSTDVGTLSPASATTDTNGIAATMVVASSSAKITATAGTLTTQMLVSSQPVPPAPLPNPSPDPPPSSPLGPLSMTVSATSVIVSNSTIFTLNILNASGAFNVAWDYGDGGAGTSTSSTSAHIYGAAGTYRATAILRDDAGRSTSANTNAVVSAAPVVPPPTPPSASLSVSVAASPTAALTGGTSTITATASANNGAAAVTSYTFDCNTDGTLEATQASPSFVCTFPTAGSITVTVTATNGTQNASGTTTVSVSVPPPPVVTVTCATVTRPTTTSCTASATIGGASVASSRITNVAWDWGDSVTTTTTTSIGTHLYAAPGTYPVQAVVTITGVTGTSTGDGTAVVQ